MNTMLVWIMVATGPNPQALPQSHYQFATQVDCLRARGKLAHYDDSLKRQWRCESITVALPYPEAANQAAYLRAQRNYRYEQTLIRRTMTGGNNHSVKPPALP